MAVQLHRRFLLSDRTYAARRLWRYVRTDGFTVGLHHVERVTRAQGLRARPRRRMLPADHDVRSPRAIAPNLLDSDFTATSPNQKWVADFTYLWTSEGWLYVAVVLDLYSRHAVGWSMQETTTAQLATNALGIT